MVKPSFWTVHQPGYELGKEATSLLLEKIEKGIAFPNQTMDLNADLIVRGSIRKK
ncbi:hypothetical protein QWY93_14825 [Echinicola jeungdonensis]|uniref:LacI family transcriptional regulator n=1 Tax=Echinicola jeungdonensis TaxID=709343 RepID=A0ABV5J350_9BACT|nr:hypothetical protein [Echinicola jeungdonensis]MDN3670594.1 hypothetical protein [Echinicola jeungdonensis]